MNKKLIKLTESDLHKIVKQSVKNILKEDQQMEQYYRMVLLNSAENMTGGEVISKLGNAMGWEKLYGYMRMAFMGDNDSYTQSQEMRGPFGSM